MSIQSIVDNPVDEMLVVKPLYSARLFHKGDKMRLLNSANQLRAKARLAKGA